MKRLLGPIALMLIASCSNYNNPAMPGAQNATPNPAPSSVTAGYAPSPDVHCMPHGNNGSKAGAIVCIDASTLDADTATVRQGTWVHFYLTDQSQVLDVRFKENGIVEYKGAGGNEVWFRIKDAAALGTHSYTARNVTTGHEKDPDILIEPYIP